MEEALLKIDNLKKIFYMKKSLLQKEQKHVRAVDGVSLAVEKGMTLGLVGESGCGKSTFGRTVLKLHSVTDGEILFKGEDITNYSAFKMRSYRNKMQMIFQDPYNSLNPRKINFNSVKSALKNMPDLSDNEKNERVAEMLAYVGISPDNYYKYPHELSGGQRQRIVIARAMVSTPDFIVCDEPVSALDVSVRSQVLNLMKDIQEKNNLSYLFISHDLSVVRFLCDKVAVMYLGKIIEIGDKESIFKRPLHPYTKSLLSAIPVPDVDRKAKRIILQGDVPSPLDPPKGCRFHTRCPYATEGCKEAEPAMAGDVKHSVACHRAAEIND